MTAAEIIALRTGKTIDEKIEGYITLGEIQVRNYLNLSDNDPLTKHQFAIADIAMFLMNKDEYTTELSDGSFLKSESFSEGGVSSSVTYEAGSDRLSYYDRCIQAVLEGLDVTARKIKFM